MAGRRPKGPRVLGPYHRRDGRWALVLRGPGLQGSVDEPHYFPSERAALRAKRRMEEGLVDTSDTSLSDAVDQYRRHLEAQSRQKSTRDEAGHRLRPLIAIVGGPSVLVRDVTPKHIDQRLATVPSVSGKKGTLGRIRTFFKWAIEKKMVVRDPTQPITVEGRPNKGKPTETRVEARRLDDALWAAATGDDPVRAETATALITMFYCGLREGELLRLQVRDLDLDVSPPILAVERHAKTYAGLRDNEIPEELADLLRPRVAGKAMTDWLWPSKRTDNGRRSKGWLRKWVKRYCTEAGVTVTCQQGLRATHGRLSREAGVTAHVIAAQLGHEDSRVTVENYIGRRTEARQRGRRALKVLKGGREQ